MYASLKIQFYQSKFNFTGGEKLFLEYIRITENLFSEYLIKYLLKVSQFAVERFRFTGMLY